MLPALAAVAVAAGAVAQAATGFGFSLVAAPFLVAAYRAPLGVQLNLLLSLAVNAAILTGTARRVDQRTAALLAAPAIVVTILIGTLLRDAATGPWTLVAGLVCLTAVAAVACGLGAGRFHGRGTVPLVGAVSGGLNVAAGIPGPPVVLLSVQAGWPAANAVPTLQAYFLAINVVGLAVLGLPDRIPAEVVLAMLVGLVGARYLAPRLPPARVRRTTLVLAAAGSVLAIGRGLAALG